MLTLEQEELPEELRREIILILHLSKADYASFPPDDMLRDAFSALTELRSSLQAINRRHAAIKLTVPPLLPSKRLREVLMRCLVEAFGSEIAVSIRIPAELADTVEASRGLVEEAREVGEAVLCFTDESAVGEPTVRLYDLRELLRQGVREPVVSAFPINHYDVLCIWDGPVDGLVWGPEGQISSIYEGLSKTPVSSTARTLAAVEDLMNALGV
jgi:hypothetical protein